MPYGDARLFTPRGDVKAFLFFSVPVSSSYQTEKEGDSSLTQTLKYHCLAFSVSNTDFSFGFSELGAEKSGEGFF